MVLFKTTIAALAILVIGVLLLGYGGQYITMTVQNVQRTNVEPHAEFLVGDVVERSYSLPGGVTALGVISITQAPSNESGEIRFLVFDEQNYQKWSSGGQASFAYSAEKQGQFNYSFTTGVSGIHHFVFDNRASLYKKYVIFSLAYDQVVTSQVPDPRTQYVAWGLICVGAILLVYGLLRKPPLVWSES